MLPLLKDAGLNGCRGSVEHCTECQRATVHFRWPGGAPICGICGIFSQTLALATRQINGRWARTARAMAPYASRSS